MPVRSFVVGLIVIVAGAAGAAEPVDFSRDVQPILTRHCLECHGAQKQRGGLRLDHRKDALAGGNTGPALIAGKSAESLLYRAVAGLEAELRMPPKEKPPLDSKSLAVLKAWIDEGAKWPETGVTVQRPGEPTHWAFRSPQRPILPSVQDAGWVRTPLDQFILARLERDGIKPSPEADRATLIRRLSLDLLGLPPTPDQIESFLSDRSPDAYERLVERFLASPHYGERWARHWLDTARYADSDGYEKDTGRPNAWRWRQWVIDAINADLPFDRFTIEQLAGDLIQNCSLDQRIATGFHRNTLTNNEGGVDKEQFRVEATLDRTATTASVWMGLTLGCAQCHDHKYDPLSQRDYYRLFAFFNNADEFNVPVDDPEGRRLKTLQAQHQKALEAYRKTLPAAVNRWEASLSAGDRAKAPAAIQALLAITRDQRTPEQRGQLHDHFMSIDPKHADLGKKQAAEVKKLQPAQAQTLREKGRPTRVLIRGDFLRPGTEVPAGVPAVFGTPPVELKNRLDLAQWLVNPRHPLTARVHVNWTWHKHFGRGLVSTLEDFGTQGDRPTHPELLDWLATELIGQGWSMKGLHRLIVCSATYRQSANPRPDLRERDPSNTLLARQNRLRLEAETIRDAALTASGVLVRTIGGPSIRPPQPAGISELTYANSARWTESTGLDRFRRGLYIWFQRTSPFPMLMTFDAPDSNVCCVRREKSNTPLQALTLLNDVTFVECAQVLGRRLASSPGTRPEQIRSLWIACLGRAPSSDEQSRADRCWLEFHDLYRTQPEAAAKWIGGARVADAPAAAAWISLARVVMNLDEFVTRE